MSNTLNRTNISPSTGARVSAPGSAPLFSGANAPNRSANATERTSVPLFSRANAPGSVRLSDEARVRDAHAERSGRDLATQFRSANAPAQPQNGNSQAGDVRSSSWSSRTAAKDFGHDSIFAFVDGVEGLPESALDSGDVHVSPPEGRPESVSQNRAGSTVSIYEDGTTVVEGHRDGHDYTTTTVKDDDGTVTTTTTYSEEGKDYTSTSQKTPNGTVIEVRDVATGDVVERTESISEKSDQPLSDLHPATGEAAHYDDEADPSTITTTRQSVIDNGQNPPTYRPVSESTVITSRVPGEHEDGSTIETGNTGSPLGPEIDLGRDVTVNQDKSGTYFTTAETILYDENGQVISSNIINGQENRVVARDANGVEVLVSESTVSTLDNLSGHVSTSSVSEARGVYTAEEAAAGYDPEFQAGFGDGYVNVRHTYTDGTQGGRVWVNEIGNYNDPDSDGRTITNVSDGSQAQITYRNVYNDGHNVDTQSVYPGTSYTDVTKGVYNDDGSYHVESYSENDGQRVSETTRDGQVVEPGEVSRDVDAGARTTFLDGAEGEIVEEISVTTTYDENGKPVVEKAVNYQATGSDANLQSISGPNGKLTAVSDGQTTYAVDGQGNRFEVNAKGEILVAGKPVVQNGSTVTVTAKDGLTAIGTVSKALDLLEKKGLLKNGGKFLDSFRTHADGLGKFFSYFGLASNALDGNLLGVAESAAGGWDDITAAGKFLGLSGKALKAFGIVGGVLNFGLAARDFFNGDAVDGGVKLATGVGVILAAFPATSAVGIAIILGATLFDLGRTILGDEVPIPDLVI